MTILTPTYAELSKTNGSAGPHVISAHEPTRSGEQPALAQSAVVTINGPLASPAPKPLKIAMIGTAPSSRMLAPFNDPSWTIWGCSPGNQNILPRVDLWFELHSNLLWPEYESYGKPYIEWLKQQKFPILMQDSWPTPSGQMVPVQSIVPNATSFPKDALVAEFGDSFFTSSFAWMMALAIKQGAREIALYGIDMASRDEYIRQRPGFFFFRYMAQTRGIKVSAPYESDIMQSPALYAYVDSTPFGRKIRARIQEVDGRLSGLDQQINQATQSKVYLQGAKEDLDYFESIWSGVANDMGRVTYENTLKTARIAQLEAEVATLRLATQVQSSVTITGNIASEITAAPARRTRRRAAATAKPEQPAAQESHNG